jgi:GDP-4-dehydro-6-deoxy-D-mannose reductase
MQQDKPQRLVITGLTGFVGKQMRPYLKNASLSRWDLVSLPPFDLNTKASIRQALDSRPPDAVIHLAGQSFVPEAFRDPAGTLNTNLIGTLNLLQSLKETGFKGAFLYVSSGDVYGHVNEAQLPITELLPANPRNPYSVSKLAAETLCRQWSYVEGWRIMIARPFNHIGPGQNESFIVPSVAKQLNLIRVGQQEPRIQVGDVDITRDFLDVQDVVNAYLQLLENGQNGEIYNVCSGRERSVRDLIETMISLSGVQAEITTDPSRFRPAEQRRVCGSYAKLHSATGWAPSINLQDTLKQVLDDWSRRLTT